MFPSIKNYTIISPLHYIIAECILSSIINSFRKGSWIRKTVQVDSYTDPIGILLPFVISGFNFLQVTTLADSLYPSAVLLLV